MNPRLETRVEWGGAAGPSLRGLIGAARVHLDLEGVRVAFGEIEATGATCIAGRAGPCLLYTSPSPRD